VIVPWHGALIATQDAPTIIAFLDELRARASLKARIS